MTPTPQMLNEALCAFIWTIPDRDRLKAHLSANQLLDVSKEITAEMNELVKNAEDYLWNFPGGVPWTDDFKLGYRAHLQQAHPWMDDRSADAISSFSGWLCWHEGLNAPETKL
ncbi:MAG: hypothetical protein K9N47_10980 [Prosthecobacter sp.]|uniref:hypothetical protein n=1 Tax=Prosthecobacter sp. TaxID=1965333 RepID=UPI0025FA44BA|nr:hypothetical protein [Prosthecobacter sp.]MCF7786636.1 hypothetical protein [Prosthecobacter sp.]